MQNAQSPTQKYLTVSILGSLRVNCFKNEEKKNPKEPDYRGNGVAIWINEKKEFCQSAQSFIDAEQI